MQADVTRTGDNADMTADPDGQAVRPADVRLAALNLLARREHALSELQAKLGRRFAAPDLVASVLQELQQENLQSDERYAESLLRQRLQRGYGPARVRQDMRERGLDEAAIAAAHAAIEPDWFALAEEVFNRKFGSRSGGPAAGDPFGHEEGVPGPDARREAQQAALREKARRMRFMQYRGFATEHFRHLLED
ncbi:MAG: regulatory protein RecX [Haliea sp.]|uniref:regulatory protein RecX n=1 Tax=Haliea sp. TaxID=1932666 RepID=UPI0032EFEF9B